MCLITVTFRTFVFFCFQQKPAYELRISDWSSDVCSSDLSTSRSVAGRLGLVLLAAALLAGCADSIAGKGFDEAAQTAGTALGRQPVWIRSDEDRAKAQARVAALQIGRASCRERVGQSV